MKRILLWEELGHPDQIDNFGLMMRDLQQYILTLRKEMFSSQKMFLGFFDFLRELQSKN